VAAFRASGNLILSDEGKDRPDRVAARIERELAKSLGYEVPVFLRTAAEVKAIAGQDTFPAKLVRASGGKLQVMFLLREPAAPSRRKVLALATDEDRLRLQGRELYWLPSGGLSDSALDLKALEALTGPTTTRTKGTVDQIAARHFAV
jgi:uncharacterized protein (DUF1697 family)